MRLRKREASETGSAVACSQEEQKPGKSKESTNTRASRSKTLEKKSGNEKSSNATDENTPVGTSDRVPRKARGGPGQVRSNVKVLRSRSLSGLRLRGTVGKAPSFRSSPLQKKKAKKKPNKKENVNTTVEEPENVRNEHPGPASSSVGVGRSFVPSSPGNVHSSVNEPESSVPPEKRNPRATSTEKNGTGRLSQEANEQDVTGEEASPNSKISVVARSFYGKAASSTNADDMQQRLKELSFTRRTSFTPSPAIGVKTKKKRKLPPKAFKATSKLKARKAPKDCCGYAVITLGSNRVLGQSNGEPSNVPLESNKFFKHHVPIGQYRCVVKDGIPRFLTGPQLQNKKGLIDFEYKEDVISHVAEEGGKCNNFGLASVDDLERSGIPRVSILNDNRFNLRKRKSTSEKGQKPLKRRRASSWRYVEEEVPVESFAPEARSPESVAGSRSVGSAEEFQIVTKDVGNTIVPRGGRVSTRRAEVVAAAYNESTMLVNNEARKPDETAVLAELRDRVETTKSGEQRQRHTAQESTAAKTAEKIIPTGVPQARNLRKRAATSSAVKQQEACPVPVAVLENAQKAERAGTSENNDPPHDPPGPPKRVTRRTALEPVPDLAVECPSREPSPAFDCSMDIDFTPAGCDSPRLSPSPRPPFTPAASLEPTPAAIRSRKSTGAPASGPVLHSTPIDPGPSKPQSKATKPYNPRDDAFGFSRMQFKARSDFENPFVEVLSPTKKPKELTPKIMAPKKTQPTVREALEKGAKALATSTPMKKDGSFRMSGVGAVSTRFTSTPRDNTAKRGFYGASTSTRASTDGFKGLSRLIDRLGSKQLQIDAGQKKYGAKECETCGMVFSQGEAEDEREHQKFHKQMNSALQVKSVENCRVVDVLPGVGRAVLVSAQDSKRVKEKLSDVLMFANRTVGLDSDAVVADFDAHPQRIFAAFVHDSGKIVSVIGAEPCSSAHRTMPGQGLMMDTSKRHLVKSSIFFIWTLPEFRRKGLAGLLLFRMRSILRAQGEPLTFDELAFADLTPDLHKFVTALSGQETVLVAAPPDPNIEALL